MKKLKLYFIALPVVIFFLTGCSSTEEIKNYDILTERQNEFSRMSNEAPIDTAICEEYGGKEYLGNMANTDHKNLAQGVVSLVENDKQYMCVSYGENDVMLEMVVTLKFCCWENE